jgi:lactoylglutathione lyase
VNADDGEGGNRTHDTTIFSRVLYQLSYLAARGNGSGGPAGNLPVMSELIHTCYRILEIDRSVSFYEKLGFEELARMPIRDEAINVFMGLPDDGARLELTWNKDQEEPYEIGSGYGHIAVAVDDLDNTLEQLATQGVEPERPPYTVRDGGNRLCFVRDPDGYRIELIEHGV